ncbi:MAG: thiamine phosphate synthase, partial [Zetaproteobacteria bacterium CG_4_8_14_3_um_filter_59_5]
RQASDAGADFALLSPVFPTASHPGAPHLGVEAFRELAGAASLPVIALGGITPENRAELIGFPVAAIGALLGAEDPSEAARRLRES